MTQKQDNTNSSSSSSSSFSKGSILLPCIKPRGFHGGSTWVGTKILDLPADLCFRKWSLETFFRHEENVPEDLESVTQIEVEDPEARIPINEASAEVLYILLRENVTLRTHVLEEKISCVRNDKFEWVDETSVYLRLKTFEFVLSETTILAVATRLVELVLERNPWDYSRPSTVRTWRDKGWDRAVELLGSEAIEAIRQPKIKKREAELAEARKAEAKPVDPRRLSLPKNHYTIEL